MSDNSWYEKGDFPTLRTKCIYDPKDVDNSNKMVAGKEVYVLSCFLCMDGAASVALENHDHGLKCYTAYPSDFRPIKTERELAIEEMKKIVPVGKIISWEDIAKIFYDAGYRKNES